MFSQPSQFQRDLLRLVSLLQSVLRRGDCDIPCGRRTWGIVATVLAHSLTALILEEHDVAVGLDERALRERAPQRV